MKCPKCNYENKDDALYCGMCYEPFKKERKEEQSEIEPGTQKPAEAVKPPAAKKKPGKLFPILLVVVCIVVGYKLYKRSISPTGLGGSVSVKKSPDEIEFENKIKEAIEGGKDANEIKERDYPILFWAVAWHYVDAVEFLLENGADPDTAPVAGKTETVLFDTVHSADTAIAAIDFENLKRSRMIAELLIKHGADVNYVHSEDTPLHQAALIGRADLCTLFIENGARVDAIGSIGRTALHSAAHAGFWEAAQVLLENGIDPNVEDRLGKTALARANERARESLHREGRKIRKKFYAGNDYDKTIQVLKEHGAQ